MRKKQILLHKKTKTDWTQKSDIGCFIKWRLGRIGGSHDGWDHSAYILIAVHHLVTGHGTGSQLPILWGATFCQYPHSTAMMIFATTWSYRPAMSSTTSVAFLTITGKIYSISIYIDTWQLMSIFQFSTGSHGSSERRNLSFFVDSF